MFPRDLATAYDNYIYARYEHLLRSTPVSQQSLLHREMFVHYALMIVWLLLASYIFASQHDNKQIQAGNPPGINQAQSGSQMSCQRPKTASCQALAVR